jgi:formyl-CoA transferase
MFDAVLAFTLVEHLSKAAVPGGHSGYNRIMTQWRGPHRTKDGYVALMPYTDAHWRRLFAAVGREELLDQPWYADHATRLANAERVYAELAGIAAERTTGEWLELCEREGIPANPIPSLDEILADESLHRGMVSLADHPVIGPYRSIGPGMILDESPLTVRRPAPLRSQHTAEVLAEVGYTAEEISAMVADGAAEVRGT